MLEIKDAVKRRDANTFKALLWNNIQSIDSYLRGFRLDDSDFELTNNYVSDALKRFLFTLELLPLTDNVKVLELGANPYFFSILMSKFFAYDMCYANFFAENIYEDKIETFKQRIENKNTEESFEFISTLFNLEKADPYPYKENTFDIVLCCETL